MSWGKAGWSEATKCCRCCQSTVPLVWSVDKRRRGAPRWPGPVTVYEAVQEPGAYKGPCSRIVRCAVVHLVAVFDCSY